MTPEEKALLQKVVVLSEENNQILRSIRRGNRWSLVLSILYWVIVLGVSFSVYIYLQPYVDQLLNVYSQLSGTVGKMSSVGSNFLK